MKVTNSRKRLTFLLQQLDYRFLIIPFGSNFFILFWLNENVIVMDDDKSLLIRTLGDSPKMKIIDFLMENMLFDFSKKEIIEEIGMSKKTFYKVWPEVEEQDMVKKTRKYGKAQLYQINRENPVVIKLFEIEKDLIDKAAEEAKKKEIPV